MLREFSTLLILLFMLLSPVSYASEDIPDFSPECPMSELCGLRMTVAGVDGTSHTLLPLSIEHTVAGKLTVPRALVPLVVWTKTSSFGRAPPA
jgi:hypothetical protein